MLSFDAESLEVKLMHVKFCTTGKGGYIITVENGTETNHPINPTMARNFSKTYNGQTKFLNPVLAAVTFYEDVIVAIESMAELQVIDGQPIPWNSFSSVARLKREIIASPHKFFFDGEFLYAFHKGIKSIRNLNKSGNLFAICVVAYKLSKLNQVTGTYETERYCVGFRAGKDVGITGPNWSSYELLIKSDKSKSTTTKFPMDSMDANMGVNINFALKASNIISDIFGFEAIEPLNLHELMINLRCVNLPNIPQHAKMTYDIGMKVSHALAWMVGLLKKTDNIHDIMNLNNLITFLFTWGTYSKEMIEDKNVYKKEESKTNIPLLELDDAMKTEVSHMDIAITQSIMR